MDKLQVVFSLAIGIGIYSLLPSCDELIGHINTAIKDSGYAKPTKLELKQTKTNAEVYNYPALSASY